MSLKEIFSQKLFTRRKLGTNDMKKHRIECDTKELKDFVTKWTGNDGWKFENFADFLELIGVKTPVKLKDFKRGERSFKCLTASGTEVLISVNFGDYIEWNSEISITEGEETRVYLTNSKCSNGENKPKVTLQRRVIKKGLKELRAYYCSYFFSRTLKLNDKNILKVEIHEPKNKEKSENLISRNSLEIDNYLLGLDNTLSVSEVYDTVIRLLGFEEEDVKNSEKNFVSYGESLESEEKILSRILVSKGQLKEYAIHEDGETFHIFEDGSWKYYFEGIKVSYLKKEKRYTFEVTETEENMVKIYPGMTIDYAEKRISEIWKSMENTRRFS